ncbi:MAG: 50S ribosomal protein L9, partial [Bacteroidota bacterium]
MEVILIQPVRNLGDVDDIVKVKPGYARNYLLPQGYAIMATPTNIKVVEERKRQAEHKQEFVQQQAQEVADKLADVKLTIETLAGGDGKLFGSVTALQIANKLKEKGFDIDRRKITLDDIRQTGEYTAIIHLHK